MGRQFAASLGYLAAALVLLHGVLMGAGVEGTLLRSVMALVVFALVGLVLGTIAETTIVHSVRDQFERALSRHELSPQ